MKVSDVTLLGQGDRALILSLEAIFALFIGIIVANEYLNLLNWFGVILVLMSIFLVIKE